MTTKNKPQVGDIIYGSRYYGLLVGIVVRRGNTHGDEEDSAFTSYWFMDPISTYNNQRPLKWTEDSAVTPVSPGVWQHV